MEAPRVGLSFLHKYWTDANSRPLLYQVTAIRNGVAFIKAAGEKKAKESVSLDRWDRVFGGTPCTKTSPKPIGRPPVSKEGGPAEVIRARVGAERAEKFRRLGGAEWLRKVIDKARE